MRGAAAPSTPNPQPRDCSFTAGAIRFLQVEGWGLRVEGGGCRGTWSKGIGAAVKAAVSRPARGSTAAAAAVADASAGAMLLRYMLCAGWCLQQRMPQIQGVLGPLKAGCNGIL